jgi:hypothetical protein
MPENSRGLYYSSSYKFPRLRRQDLVKIEDVILNELRPQRYHIACHGLEYNRVAEVSPNSKCETTLVVYTHAPCLRLKFARSWAELYCEENSDSISGAIQRISAIVSARESRGLWLWSRFAIWAAPMIGFGTFCEIVILVSTDRLPREAAFAGSAVLALCYLWWILSYRLNLYRFSRIDLNSKEPTKIGL